MTLFDITYLLDERLFFFKYKIISDNLSDNQIRVL